MTFEAAKLTIQACIKGYHEYHSKVDVGVVCEVRKEHGNRFDQHAMVVQHDGTCLGHVPHTPPVNDALHEISQEFPGFPITW